VEIAFTLGEHPAEFRRNSMTGRAELRIGDDVTCLQSPFRLTTHFDFRKRVVWRRQVGDRQVEIVKTRPRVFGGVRQSSYAVAVDGMVVAEVTGK
jgi:hypothetical protein